MNKKHVGVYMYYLNWHNMIYLYIITPVTYIFNNNTLHSKVICEICVFV